MKRVILSIAVIVVASVCLAQDVIVKNDGSTILSIVKKVWESEIEYVKYSNQNGPIYTMSKKSIIVRIPADTRSPIPVISVHLFGNLQYRLLS